MGPDPNYLMDFAPDLCVIIQLCYNLADFSRGHDDLLKIINLSPGAAQDAKKLLAVTFSKGVQIDPLDRWWKTLSNFVEAHFLLAGSYRDNKLRCGCADGQALDVLDGGIVIIENYENAVMFSDKLNILG